MEHPNTPSQPPLYSNPPSYMNEENSTPTDGQSNAAMRLLTSMDESNSRPYVQSNLVPRPLAIPRTKSSKLSTPKHLSSLREEEAISTCKLQAAPKMADTILPQCLPAIPDGPSRRRPLRKPIVSSTSKIID